MKELTLFFIAFILSVSLFAQNSGRGFSYQAVARDDNGAIRKNEAIEIRFSLLQGGSTGVEDWIEEHTVNTDIYGTFSVIIGTGLRNSNSTYSEFEELSFSNVYWLKTEIKESGNYIELSNQKLLSVPYAENIGTPVGSIMPYMGTTAPAGWLMCDGSEIDRAQYARLFAVIGTNSGFTDDSNFRVPDFRGRFLRGASGTTTNDPDRNTRAAQNSGGATGNNIGSLQPDAIRNITGSLNPLNNQHGYTVGTGSGAISTTNSSTQGWESRARSGWVTGWNFDASREVPIGSDNRPTNISVNYIIKY